MSTEAKTYDADIHLGYLTDMDDLSSREWALIELGMHIGRAQNAAGEPYPNMTDVAALFLDPEDRDAARAKAREDTEDSEFANALGDAQQCIYYTRSQDDVCTTFN